MVSKGVVLLSGGIDSTVTAFIAKEECDELYLLTLLYGQTHYKEVRRAALIAEKLGIKIRHKVLRLPLDSIGSSSLLGKGEIPKEKIEGIPSTWVPQRNAIFLALAFGWAEVVGTDRVYIGANIVDYSGYPDCSPEFIRAMENALNLASKRFVETGQGISIVAPLMDRSKKEIIKLGLRLGVPFNLTWSCYHGKEKACGKCPSCRIRLEAFRELGEKDPAEYE